MLLAFDTETTGLPVWSLPSEAAEQPHIVQLAAVLRSHNREEEPHKVINYIIKPDGWIIPPEITAIHGITTERAMDEGVPLNDVLDEFFSMFTGMGLVERLIGFGLNFDKRMIRIAEKRRYGGDTADDLMPIGHAMTRLTEIELSSKMTKHCNLAPTDKMMASGRKTSKTPKLSEAFEHCYPGKNLDGEMHDALTDVKATMAVYWWLHDRVEV